MEYVYYMQTPTSLFQQHPYLVATLAISTLERPHEEECETRGLPPQPQLIHGYFNNDFGSGWTVRSFRWCYWLL